MDQSFCRDYFGYPDESVNGGVLCNIPSHAIGFNAYREWSIQTENGPIKGTGYGWSYTSQAEADAMALDRAKNAANFLSSL